MPEIGEVARIVHYLRKHLVNRKITTIQAFEDAIVYGKVGCSAQSFQDELKGKRVTGAGQQGKYFYLTFDSSPHSVMHLGMTGWIKFSTEETGYYRKPDAKEEEWPPKYMKWLIKCEAEGDREAVEIAFVDARRLARIRLVDCKAGDIRNQTPLKENGPDPVIDKDIVTVEWLAALLSKKRVPVKALLLDQGNISGVGNWVADEVLYQAKLHPEQYSNTFDKGQIQRLYDALVHVCTTACETLADSEKFPADWLMKYRWDKGKRNGSSNVLPNGEKIVHLTVGGRTSAIVPSVQKKTAAVAGDMSAAQLEDGEGNEVKEQPVTKRSRKKTGMEANDDAVEKPVKRKKLNKPEKELSNMKDVNGGTEKEAEAEEAKSKRVALTAAKSRQGSTSKRGANAESAATRRSSRNKV